MNAPLFQKEFVVFKPVFGLPMAIGRVVPPVLLMSPLQVAVEGPPEE
jgi:hypothetical protein